MTTKNVAKQERVIESIRRGLTGEAAVKFVRQSGFAITDTAMTRAVHSMGGRERIQALINEGKSNVEVLQIAFPAADANELKELSARKAEHRSPAAVEGNILLHPEDHPLYETAKMTIHLPADVYEAIRLAARAEGRTQNQLIVDLLTWGLSQIPRSLFPGSESDPPD